MDFILDAHMHTVASGHAYSTVKEYIDMAIEKGLELIAFTDHAPELLGAPKELYFSNLRILPKKIKELEILSGIELNIMDTEGTIDLKEELLKNLDVVIASLHTVCFIPSTKEDNTKAVLNTMENPLVKIIGHLGDPRYPLDVNLIVEKSIQTGTIIEVNNSSFRQGGYRIGGDKIVLEILSLCKKHDMPIILGSDAHICYDVGGFSLAEKIIKQADMPLDLILNSSVSLFKQALKLNI